MKSNFAKILIIVMGALCLTPYVSSAIALFAGVAIAVVLGNPFAELTRKASAYMLSLSIVGMGAGMDLNVIGKVGLQGLGYTVFSIGFTVLIGFLIGRQLKVEKRISDLITVGTAICGGSAIAAVSPAIKAQNHETSVALGTVFLLNAVALFIFPTIGHYFGLTQSQFGLWSALAIHDTSSVIGASMQYGKEALEIATTIKLARALWIIPITFVFGFIYREKLNSQSKNITKKPWFILGFCLVSAVVTFLPSLYEVGLQVSAIAKQVLVLTLFLIGLNLTKENIKSVGVRAFAQGCSLWFIVSVTMLTAIKYGLID